MAEQAGLPVKKAKSLLCVTRERYDNGYASKIHVMLIPECDVELYLDCEYCETICVEQEKHCFRIHTLQAIAREQEHEKKNPPRDDIRRVRFFEAAFRL